MTAAASSTEHIFYDGDCGVCHWSVGFVARRDRSGETFRFAPIGGSTFLERIPVDQRRDLPDSMIVWTGGELLMRSDAASHILRRLGFIWKLAGYLMLAVPRPIRDWCYDRFAERRHRLARRPDGACPILPPELRSRFDA